MRAFWSAYFSLFTSFSTLICCALPSLLISFGFGAVVITSVEAVPQLITLTENKGLLFSASFVMLSLGTGSFWRSRNDPCPIDPQQARACTVARKWGKRALIFSWILFSIGFITAYVMPIFL